MAQRSKPLPPPPDGGPLERYLQVVSDTWVPRIIWYLRFGTRRFGELRRDLKSISSKALPEKLRALEADGLVVRRLIDASPPQVEYSLSTHKSELFRTFQAQFPSFYALTDMLHSLQTEWQET